MTLFAHFEPQKPDNEKRQLDDLIIREAEKSDVERLAAILSERENIPVEECIERFRKEIHGVCLPDKNLLLVAEVDGVVAGFARARYFEQPEDAPQNCAPAGWYLSGIVISPEYRRAGIGLAPTNHRLTRVAQSTDRVYYFANERNRVSIALHEQCGFTELTRDFFFPGVTFEEGRGILFVKKFFET